MTIRCNGCNQKIRTNYPFGRNSNSRIYIQHSSWCKNMISKTDCVHMYKSIELGNLCKLFNCICPYGKDMHKCNSYRIRRTNIRQTKLR